MLDEYNYYLQFFLVLRDCAAPVDALNPFRTNIHSDKRPVSEHIHGYNGPQASEILAIISKADDGIVERQDVVICRRKKLNNAVFECFDTISMSHHSYNTLCYVTLLPHGICGWHHRLRLHFPSFSKRQNTRMFRLTFNAYHFFHRPNKFCINLRRVLIPQQYVVDQICRVESERLEYLRHNQVSLRAADYTTFCEQL